MKRFLVFSYDQYYPCGGWDDFVADFDTLDEAAACVVRCEFRDIVDQETGTVVDQKIGKESWRA